MRTPLSTAAFSAMIIAATTGVCSEQLSEQQFTELHAQLQPGEEPWRTIPWKIALLDAQRTAVAEKKPLFIWAMDGHPLGCT